MSAAAEREIAELDKALAADGEDIILRRVVGAAVQSFNDVRCRAFVRGYAVNELVGGITQQDSKVILSPSEINRAQWPGGQPPAAVLTTDPRIPSKNRGDRCGIGDPIRFRAVEAAIGIRIDGVLVRLEMRVLG